MNFLDNSGLSYVWNKLKNYFQPKLVSGTNIKTINNTSILGSGNIPVATDIDSTDIPTPGKVAEFDSSAQMNSTDMSLSDITTLLNNLGTYPIISPSELTTLASSLGISEERLYNILDTMCAKLGLLYVTEKGTDNNWKYKRYSDGTFEAWRSYQLSNLSLTSQSGGTYYGNSGYRDINLPSFCNHVDCIFTNETSSQSSGVFIYNADTITGNKIRVECRAHSSINNASCGAYILVYGTI